MPLTKFISRWSLAQSKVDRVNGVVKDVSLVTLGEARGHNKFADQKTLEQVRDCAKQYKGGLRIRFNPYTFNHGDAGLVGFMPPETIRVEGDRTVGDIHTYAAYPALEYFYEIAERAPDNFGLSMEFNGDTEEIENKFYARCDEIFAATVVDLPAANPTGLFHAKDEESLTTIRQRLTNVLSTKTETAMTPDEIKAIVTGIVDGLKPTLMQFRQQQVTDEPPTAEELVAAGCTDNMTPEAKQAAVNEWRKKADSPLTRKDLMQFFRLTGGAPVKVSGGEGVSKDGDNGFTTTVRKYVEAGMNESKAINRAAHDNKRGYNEWCKAGRPALNLK